MADRLLAVAPMEASVERVFSRMKLNANRLRTSLAPSAAAAQVIFNEAKQFNSSTLVTASTHHGTAVPASTFLWIVQQGAKNFDVAEEEPEIDDTICAICEEAHDDDEGRQINGPLYLQWWVCVRCGRWYAVSCLGIYQEEFDRRKDDHFECFRFPSCKSKPTGYQCERYKTYAKDAAKKNAEAPKRRR
jgi:hypothetical protein